MIVDRRPEDEFGITRVYLYPDAAHQQAHHRHEVNCSDFDYDRKTDTRVTPTAKIYLLGAGVGLEWTDVQRLADDYAVIADIAMKLEAELRTKYEATYAAPPADV
jgi:hypothetical protein